MAQTCVMGLLQVCAVWGWHWSPWKSTAIAAVWVAQALATHMLWTATGVLAHVQLQWWSFSKRTGGVVLSGLLPPILHIPDLLSVAGKDGQGLCSQSLHTNPRNPVIFVRLGTRAWMKVLKGFSVFKENPLPTSASLEWPRNLTDIQEPCFQNIPLHIHFTLTGQHAQLRSTVLIVALPL